MMTVFTTIMNTATGKPIQKMKFGRMPRPGAVFTLETGERVTAQRIEVGKPAAGKFIAPIDIWVSTRALEGRGDAETLA